MASEALSLPLSGVSSQAGLATLAAAPATAAPRPSRVLELIDAYALACAERAAREASGIGCAGLLEAHRTMLAARDAVAAALGIPSPAPLADPLADLVAFAESYEARR